MKLILVFLFSLTTMLMPMHASPIKVFVIAGQSNAVGFGTQAGALDATPEEENIKYYFQGGGPPPGPSDPSSGGEWIKLSSRDTKFGPEIGIGRILYGEVEEPVAIIKIAYNGTNLAEDWDPLMPESFELYPLLISEIDKALALLVNDGLAPIVAGFFWMQGENDAKDKVTGLPVPPQPEAANNYGENLDTLIDTFRDYYNEPEMIVIIGRISDQSSGTIISAYNLTYWDQVRAAQVSIGETKEFTDWVDTDDLSQSDWVHFDNSGMLALGERMANSWLNIVQESFLWAGYEINENGNVDTGSWLGLVHIYPNEDWVYIHDLDSFAYLPEAVANDPEGSWAFVPQTEN